MYSGEIDGKTVEHESYAVALCSHCGKLPYLTEWSVRRSVKRGEHNGHEITRYRWYNGQWNLHEMDDDFDWTAYRDLRTAGYTDLA